MLKRVAAAAAGLMLPASALAAGIEHVVDDAAVEAPGHCHAESWITGSGARHGLLVLAPACTPRIAPNLELGGFVIHAWAPGARGTQIGLAPKVQLRDQDKTVGVALAASAGYGIGSRRIETATVTMPVSVPASERLRLSLALGWQWARGTGHAPVAGAQAELTVGRAITLMAETFANNHAPPGAQAGVRWTSRSDKIDVDLVVGRYVAGAPRTSASLGVALRY